MNRAFISLAPELINNYFAVHPVHVMKGAVIIEMPFVGKKDTDPRRPRRHLGRSGSIRFRCLNEPGVQETIRIKGRWWRRDRVLLRFESSITGNRPGSRGR